MKTSKPLRRALLCTTITAMVSASMVAALPAKAQSDVGSMAPAAASVRPTNDLTVSVGTGRMVRLDGAISDLFVANDAIADVQVRSSNQIYVFGKGAGQTTIFATNKAGKVVYSANVRVGNNFETVGDMLRLAMPEAQIRATPMNGAVLLTGTVLSPADVEEANRLVSAYVGEGTQVLSRLKTATPQQVMLRVKIAEVSRSLTRNLGVNLLTQDNTGGFQFGIAQGTGINVDTGQVIRNPLGSTISGAGNLFGLDVIGALNLNEQSGLVTTLAEPTLTALSGETASFLAGGEFPILLNNGINGNSVEFKQYGVSLAFTPFVLEGGRISLRVRPEVSEITANGAVRIGGSDIPALTTRRAETTVELGSGQSFMIGGLINHTANNNVDKTPWLGDLPIIGALFRSKGWRRAETELVIIVTPYLVQPVNAQQIALPTDGFRISGPAKDVFFDQRNSGRSGEKRPEATIAPSREAAPGIGSVGAANVAVPPSPIQQAQAAPARTTASAQPGFSF